MKFGRVVAPACLFPALAASLVACGAPDSAPSSTASGAVPETAPPAADLVIAGTIYTNSEIAPIAAWLSVRQGEIIEIGTDAAALAPLLAGFDGEVIELAPGTVAYPGFTDAHAHLAGIGFRELTLNLEGTGSVKELQARIAAEIAARPDAEILVGRGWIETGWPEGRFPSRDDLDAVAADIPVILTRADGHAMVVNSAALAAAGVSDLTADPDGGRLERDGSGRLTGMLIDNAMALVAGLVAEPTREQRREALKIGAEVYAGRGWTGLHNMSVPAIDADLLAELEEAGELPIRVYNALDAEAMPGLIESGIWEMNDGKVTTRAVKFYVDGALGSRGAALHEPYTDRPDTSGLVLLSHDEAIAAWQTALDHSIQVATHAIGDRGNTLVLDWYEEVLPDERQSYPAGPRWRIEHAQILEPGDLPRFAQLGVIASMQPSHAIGDLHFAPARLGLERLAGAYAWHSLAEDGATIAGGSDAPVERGDPMIEFYAAVARRDLEGYRGEGWHPEEVLSRGEALDLFTWNAALASFNEDRLGTLEPGKKADLSVFDADIMTVPEADIPQVRAVMTIVDGKVVYEAAD